MATRSTFARIAIGYLPIRDMAFTYDCLLHDRKKFHFLAGNRYRAVEQPGSGPPAIFVATGKMPSTATARSDNTRPAEIFFPVSRWQAEPFKECPQCPRCPFPR